MRTVLTSLFICLSALSVQATPAPENLMSHFIRACALAQMPDMKMYRMELDVTGDGTPELFLSSEESKGVGGQEWCIYSSRPDGGGYHYIGRLGFHVAGFRYDEETVEFSVWIRYSGSEGQVASYRIDDAGIHGVGSSERLTFDDPKRDEEWEKFTASRRERPVDILYVEFGAYFQPEPPPWRHVTTDNPVEHAVSSLRQREVVSSSQQ